MKNMIKPTLPQRKTGFMTRAGNTIRDFGQRKDGAAAVEFAFVVPIMLSLYLGTMELSQGLEINKKATRASSLVADLVTQQSVISKSEIIAIANVAAASLFPYKRAAPTVRVVGIQITDEPTPKAKVAWSQQVVGGAGSAFLVVGSDIAIPPEMLIRNTFLIRGGLALNYYPFTTYNINTPVEGRKGIGMGEAYYLRPRLSPTITCPSC
jgi:Flp pilus assembly protein TadG